MESAISCKMSLLYLSTKLHAVVTKKDDNFHITNFYHLKKLKYFMVIISTVLVKFYKDYNISFNYCNNKIPYCKRDKISTDFVAKFKNNAFTCHSNILVQHIIIISIASLM
jgi:hypothetical protein